MSRPDRWGFVPDGLALADLVFSDRRGFVLVPVFVAVLGEVGLVAVEGVVLRWFSSHTVQVLK